MYFTSGSDRAFESLAMMILTLFYFPFTFLLCC